MPASRALPLPRKRPVDHATRPAATCPLMTRAIILSLVAGVQRSTLALMAFRNEFPPSFGGPMAAIFADGFQLQAVYRHLAWLIEILGTGLPAASRAARPEHRRIFARTPKRSCTATLRSSPIRPSSPGTAQCKQYPHAEQQHGFETYLIRSRDIPRFVALPSTTRISALRGRLWCSDNARVTTSSPG
jgi:hypothetical protein